MPVYQDNISRFTIFFIVMHQHWKEILDFDHSWTETIFTVNDRTKQNKQTR